jgi:hypothetical protein
MDLRAGLDIGTISSRESDTDPVVCDPSAID